MSSETLIAQYLMGPELLRRAVAEMTREQLLARPIPGKWSTQEVVCHLADYEPIYADRMKRVIALEAPELLKGDPGLFAARLAYDHRDIEEVLFEGCLRAEPGGRYPICVKGERACPPEDVGGVWGYQEFLEAMAECENEEREELLECAGGSFDPEAFDAATATKRLRRGLPDWRSERWI